jgi:hypothetical protein
MLVFIKKVVSKRFECVGKEKKFYAKMVQKGACLDCGFVNDCLQKKEEGNKPNPFQKGHVNHINVEEI